METKIRKSVHDLYASVSSLNMRESSHLDKKKLRTTIQLRSYRERFTLSPCISRRTRAQPKSNRKFSDHD